MSSRLELPGQGIFQPKYDRVVAQTQEQLLAFAPEVPMVLGFVRGTHGRWLWTGEEWKRVGVKVLSSLTDPGSVDELGLFGGKLYYNRFVGNFVNNGASTRTDYITNTSGFDANQDFEVTIKFLQDVDDPVGFTGLITGGGSTTTTRGIWLERDSTSTAYLVDFYNSIGQKLTRSVDNVVDGNWHNLNIKRSNNTITIKKDGEIQGTPIDATSFTINSSVPLVIGSQPTSRTMNGQIAYVKLTGTNSFEYKLNTGSGSVAVDSLGANNGVIYDGAPNSFWTNTWVPLEYTF